MVQGSLQIKLHLQPRSVYPLLLWCTLVNSILIGLFIIAVSVSLYMSINVSKASNIKADLQKLVTTLSQKIDKLEHAQGQIQTEILQNTNRLNETTELQKLVTTQSQKLDELEQAQGQIQSEFLQNLKNRLSETGEVLQKLVTTLSQKIDKIEHAHGQIQTEVLQNTNRLNEANVSVGFAVRNPDKNSSGSPLTFKYVIYNTGDDYNVSSGVFTCRHPGLYFFTSTMHRSPGARESACGFYVNSINKLTVYSGNGVNDGFQSGSASLVYRLNTGDIVELSHCRGIDHMYFLSSFTGFRVSY
ncbi:uncharacterized protein LOC132740150 isoform X2 [Ruditapes philippinarum]|uniref:uncharacterized protein LOC132740150 isoform X2 n=1 Tax=Ruditapes philippinarum TaxID=129788 RepID=UPI00295AE90B|nr:uncharacterized protein LOC132740150 isoform X2 [Ruditapes philippinarum]